MFTTFDSPALFGRDINMFEIIVGTWIDEKPASYDNLPVSILYLSDYLPLKNEVQMRLVDDFLSDFELAQGVRAKKVSVAEQWKTSAPSEVGGASLDEYFKDVGVNTFCYGLYHALDDFRAEYHEKYDKEPYVNPVTRWRWDVAKTVTPAQHVDAMHRMDVYKNWFLEQILQIGKQNTLLVLPITTQAPDYRDAAPEGPSAPSALDSLWLAPILGAPEISLPIGEMPYHSTVSQRTEYLPIAVSLMGPPRTDMALIDAACHCIEKSGRPSRVLTGSRMFQ